MVPSRDLPCRHVGVVGATVTGINDGVASINCVAVVVITRQAVRRVARSWSVHQGQVGELLSRISVLLIANLKSGPGHAYPISYAIATKIDRSEPLGTENR